MIREAIMKIVDKQDLSFEEAYTVMNEIMSGETTPTQNAAYLAALSTKSSTAETVPEIAGSAKAMREHATPVLHEMPVMEIVGTGGDGAHTFNISTTTAFVLAAGGVTMAKHGNRAASSLSGAADCLEALGANISIPADRAEMILRDVGFCFLFAQAYHSSMKYVGAIRKELGIRTVFNILGPITNPASPEYFLLGVYSDALLEIIASVLMQLGVERGMVVYGTDKLDEVAISCPTMICEINHGYLRKYTITPEEFGITRAPLSELTGGTPAENAAVTRAILAGELTGAKKDVVLMNAGCGLYIGGKASSVADGIAQADEILRSGRALKVLDAFVAASNA